MYSLLLNRIKELIKYLKIKKRGDKLEKKDVIDSNIEFVDFDFWS